MLHAMALFSAFAESGQCSERERFGHSTLETSKIIWTR
jgi:hypothetical protein